MEIKLLVIRTTDIKKLADFYSSLGFIFEYHKHGKSPYHYAAIAGKTVVEIYPLAKEQAVADKNLRLGFCIDNFETIISQLQQAKILFTEPAMTDFGFMTIITDPDGRKIELYKQ